MFRYASFLCVILVGCGYGEKKRQEPVPVSATIKFADGKPVADVTCCFRPTDSAQMPLDVKLDSTGKFKMPPGLEAKLVPGKYMLFFSSAGNDKAIKSIPAKYKNEAEKLIEAEVGPTGADLTITLEG